MKFGSVCSGIEAASVAWHPLGWEAAWFSEIEPFPSAVLAHHYPGVPNLGNMTRLPDLIRSGAIEVPDILCGGTPCQAFSVAGLRRSLDDERGNLSLTFCEIADAIDEHRPSIIFWENVPGVLNTKDNAFGCFLAGLAGEDAPLVPPGGRWTNAGFVDGPARAVAWRVLDAQYFGVAQRRRRVFVVASARADFDPAAVLFEFKGVRRDSAPRRETEQEVAGTFTARARSGGWGQDPNLAAGGYMRAVAPTVGTGAPFSRSGNDRTETEAIVAVCPTLRAGGNRTGGDRPPGTDVDTADSLIVQPYTVANCLTQRMHKGVNSTLGEGQPPVLAHALRGEGFDASEDGTGRGTPLIPVAHVETMPTMLNGANTEAGHNARSGHTKDQYIVPVAMRESGQGYWMQDNMAGTLRAEGENRPSRPSHEIGVPVAFNDRQDPDCWQDRTGPLDTSGFTQAVGTDCYNGQITGDVAATMGTPGSSVNASGPTVMQPYTLAIRGRGDTHQLEYRQDGTANALLTPNGGRAGIGVGAVAAPTIGWDEELNASVEQAGTLLRGGEGGRHDGVMQPVAPSLTASNDPSRSPQSAEVTQQVNAVYASSMQVRRLTPVECERLQGFPDNYTNIPWRGKPESPDGPRYKALGNSWAVPVVRWIGGRIASALA